MTSQKSSLAQTTNLSNVLTSLANEEIRETYTKNKFKAKAVRGLQSKVQNVLSPTEFAQKMHETDEGIKSAVYKLQKVAGKPLPVVEIGADTTCSISLSQGIPYFCKIGIERKKPPLTFSFKYTSGEA